MNWRMHGYLARDLIFMHGMLVVYKSDASTMGNLVGG